MILDKKQRRAFQTVLSGLKFARFGGKQVRFLTLTTSVLQANVCDYDITQDLTKNFQVMYKRIKRYSPWRLYKEGYISDNKMKSKYRNAGITKKFDFEYFKVQTNEGNGVLHILYRGEWLPYNFLVDNWQDIHISWDINIKYVNMDDIKEASSYVVSQYMSSQESSYVRSSQSWKWIFRGFKSKWYLLKYHYRKFPSCFKNNLFDIWDNILKEYAENYFYPQRKLADFG
jgi:hypothetical protein